MKIIYLDCFSGISGDMTLAALVDAGADKDYVEQELAKLDVDPYTLRWSRVNKRGLSALKLDVLLDEAAPPKVHRHYSDIVEMIIKAEFSQKATALALAIFGKIAVAEAKIHGVSVEHVHFHEVGAVDSIVDIIGVALAIDSLEADKIICSPVPLGSGTVRIDHGVYPVPAPATLEMMRGIPVAESRIRLEQTTPTGAGIVAGAADCFNMSLPSMIVDSIGYGAGTRDLADQPNVLRVVIGHTEPHLNKWHPQHELHQLDHTHDHAHHHQHHEHIHQHDGHTRQHQLHDHVHHAEGHTHEHTHEAGSHTHGNDERFPQIGGSHSHHHHHEQTTETKH